MSFTIKLFIHLNCQLMQNWIVWNRTIFIKMNLALNNLQRLICKNPKIPTIHEVAYFEPTVRLLSNYAIFIGDKVQNQYSWTHPSIPVYFSNGVVFLVCILPHILHYTITSSALGVSVMMCTIVTLIYYNLFIWKAVGCVLFLGKGSGFMPSF